MSALTPTWHSLVATFDGPHFQRETDSRSVQQRHARLEDWLSAREIHILCWSGQQAIAELEGESPLEHPRRIGRNPREKSLKGNTLLKSEGRDAILNRLVAEPREQLSAESLRGLAAFTR